jgi:hypothetical protein
MYLTDEQRRRLARRAKDAGVSQAEVIRRILDEALGLDDGTDELLAAFDAAFGICKDYPDWPEWLASVRSGKGADARLKELGL